MQHCVRIATKYTTRLKNSENLYFLAKKHFLQIVEQKRSINSKRYHLFANERSAVATCNS